MQFNQPFSSTFPTYGQYFGFNPPPMQNVTYPEVIGEGEVTSVFLQDGSFQYYFKPTSFVPTYNLYTWNTDPRSTYPYCNSCGVWFIRKISNPIPYSAFSQQCQTCDSTPHLTPFLKPAYKSEHQLNIPLASYGYQLKFHNDHATSTTDLHYFYPRIRNSVWFPKPCATVQVDLPVKDDPCNKPCCCKIAKQPEQFSCKKNGSSTSCSSMSVEDNQKECQLSLCKKTKTKKKRKKKNKAECDCKVSTDKAVTTFSDQASGSTTEKGRKTQTTQNSKYLTFSCLSDIFGTRSNPSNSSTSVEVSECACSSSSDDCTVCANK